MRAGAKAIATIVQPSFRGAEYMFCIHARGPARTPIATNEAATASVTEDRLPGDGGQDLRYGAGGREEHDQVGAREVDVGEVFV